MGEFVMHRLFPIVCNMSLTASVVILAVLAVRLLLRRAPKVFSYALWGGGAVPAAVSGVRHLRCVPAGSAGRSSPGADRRYQRGGVCPGGHCPRYGPHGDAAASGAVSDGTRREHRQRRPQRDSA